MNVLYACIGGTWGHVLGWLFYLYVVVLNLPKIYMLEKKVECSIDEPISHKSILIKFLTHWAWVRGL